MSRITKYKLSINNLILASTNYPFDFFLRIRQSPPSLTLNLNLNLNQKDKQQYQDSPIIQANTLQCDQLFPWQFAVSSTRINIQFIQISTSTQLQIVKGVINIESTTDQDGKTIAMLANRTGKKLCFVTYVLEVYVNGNGQRQRQRQVSNVRKGKRQKDNKKRNGNYFDQNWQPQQQQLQQLQNNRISPIKKSPTKSSSTQQAHSYTQPLPHPHIVPPSKSSPSTHKPLLSSPSSHITFSKQQHLQLSRQIQQINKSIDKLLDHQKSQHAIFSKYLDQSTSFIKEMMNQSKSMRGNGSNNQSKINQEDEEEQQRSRQRDRQRDRQREISGGRGRDRDRQYNVNILKQVQEQQQRQNSSNITPLGHHNNHNNQYNSNKWYKNKYNINKPQISRNINYRKQISSFNTPVGTSRVVSVVEPSLEYSKRDDSSVSGIGGSGSGSGEDGNQSSLLISDLSFNSQVMPSQVSFFEVLDAEKQKQKEKEKEKEKESGFNKSSSRLSQRKQKIQKTQNNQKQPKGQKLLLKMISPNPSYQWKKAIQLPNVSVVVISIKDDKKNQLNGCIARKEFQNQRVSLYDNKGQEKGIMKFKHKIIGVYCVQTHQLLEFVEKQEQVQKGQQEEDKPKQAKQSQDKLIIEKKQQIKQRSQAQNNKKQPSPSLEQPKKQQQNLSKDQGQKVFKLNTKSQLSSKRASKLRRMSQQNNRIESQASQRQQMQNKQDPKSPNSNPKSNKYNIVSNSVSVSFLPFMKKHSVSHKPQRSPFLSDQQFSQTSSQVLSRINNVNLKIDTVSVKLTSNNNNDFLGKFLRISMRNKNPYITQTINLSQNLTWKGKGFIFDNVSPYGQIIIQLCNDDNNKTVVIGTAKICLALLKLNKPNSIQFLHEYLRDQNQNQIGQLMVGYQNIDKNKRTLSAKHQNSQQQQKQEYQQIIPIAHKRKKKLRSKSKKSIQALISQPSNRTKKKNQNIGTQATQAKSIVGSASVIRTKKYTGGNIIIGRAARFRVDPYAQKPGPGQYEMPSTFERHVVPL